MQGHTALPQDLQLIDTSKTNWSSVVVQSLCVVKFFPKQKSGDACPGRREKMIFLFNALFLQMGKKKGPERGHNQPQVQLYGQFLMRTQLTRASHDARTGKRLGICAEGFKENVFLWSVWLLRWERRLCSFATQGLRACPFPLGYHRSPLYH